MKKFENLKKYPEGFAGHNPINVLYCILRMLFNHSYIIAASSRSVVLIIGKLWCWYESSTTFNLQSL